MAHEDQDGPEGSQEPIADWYIRVVLEAELADYTPVRGCIAIRPYGYAVWEAIQSFVDRELKATGHKNASFPSLIPISLLRREAEHVEGFAPELAIVTIGGGEKLEEELVVRPTSETIIFPMYRKWIDSYRDLPVLINQWGNAVRWERRTRPFLRGMEFLWQEGHTVHETFEDADAEARLILDMYVRLIENELAMPVMVGKKSDKERFAGAAITYTMESLMRDGRALQMGTSHHFGERFTRAFDVQFLDRDGERKFPHSTSWAVSTRLIGALVLVHGDEKGLIMPPRVAPIQVVVVPIWKDDATRDELKPYVEEILSALRGGGVRCEADWRDTVRPGFKFNQWELRGVPLRLEVGPRDLETRQVVAVRRDTREKLPLPAAGLADRIPTLLEEIQTWLFERARDFQDTNTHSVGDMDGLRKGLEEKRGLYWVNWCGERACEDAFAAMGATIRLIPLEEERATGPCIVCGKAPAGSRRVLVAKSY
jgi:prolyl-tRNA synthetase